MGRQGGFREPRTSTRIAQLGRPVSEDRALALEAAHTALLWTDHPAEARGGPYCNARLSAEAKSELKLLAKSLVGKRSQHALAEAVLTASRQLPRRGPLNRHLRKECFRCGGAWLRCSCHQKCCKVKDFPEGTRQVRRRSGVSESGSRKRKRWNLEPASDAFKKHKWGKDVVGNMRRDKNKWNSQNPTRPR